MAVEVLLWNMFLFENSVAIRTSTKQSMIISGSIDEYRPFKNSCYIKWKKTKKCAECLIGSFHKCRLSHAISLIKFVNLVLKWSSPASENIPINCHTQKMSPPLIILGFIWKFIENKFYCLSSLDFCKTIDLMSIFIFYRCPRFFSIFSPCVYRTRVYAQ